jgi:hypothetical protein
MAERPAGSTLNNKLVEEVKAYIRTELDSIATNMLNVIYGLLQEQTEQLRAEVKSIANDREPWENSWKSHSKK